jgi:hypothetical protein
MRHAAGAQATKHDTGTATTRPITTPNESRGASPNLVEVRALSLWRPWPYLILHGGKDVENRTWGTGYRGLLVLHAGKVIDRPTLATMEQCDGLAVAHLVVLESGYVGVAELVEVHAAVACYDRHGPDLCSPWAASDGWHWRLRDPRPFPATLPGPGRQRLFIPPAAAIEAVAEVMR